jgi:hypothetical protein
MSSSHESGRRPTARGLLSVEDRHFFIPLLCAGALAGALLSGCVRQSDLPSDCSAPAVHRQASLAGAGSLDPKTIDVCRNQKVTLDVATQRSGELHLHGYDDQGAEIEIKAGATAHLAFTAVHAGQFILEVHNPDGFEVQVGILTVHEP